MRILVTGSRDWRDTGKVHDEIMRATMDALGPHVIVHGACPTGADADADWVARAYVDLKPERHPADWSRGRKAGPERNAHMVSLGADLCLAFISDCTSPRCHIDGKHPSHGATGCAALAESAGIPTRRFTC